MVGLALLLAALFYSLANLGLMPSGGSATNLPIQWTIVAVAVHFLLGVLVSFGVGNYAPTLAMLSLMGMDPRLAFPVMASAASFAGVAAAGRSIQLVKLDYRIGLGLALGAIPAVLVAALIVKEMPMTVLRWLLVVVVFLCRNHPARERSSANGCRSSRPCRHEHRQLTRKHKKTVKLVGGTRS